MVGDELVVVLVADAADGRQCAVALDCGSDVFMADDTLLRAGSYASEPLSDANPWGAVEVRAPFRLGTPRD